MTVVNRQKLLVQRESTFVSSLICSLKQTWNLLYLLLKFMWKHSNTSNPNYVSTGKDVLKAYQKSATE